MLRIVYRRFIMPKQVMNIAQWDKIPVIDWSPRSAELTQGTALPLIPNSVDSKPLEITPKG